jgi:hypothetical protein
LSRSTQESGLSRKKEKEEEQEGKMIKERANTKNDRENSKKAKNRS